MSFDKYCNKCKSRLAQHTLDRWTCSFCGTTRKYEDTLSWDEHWWDEHWTSSSFPKLDKPKEPEKVQAANAYDLLWDFQNQLTPYPSAIDQVDILCDFIDDQGIQEALEKYLEKRKANWKDDVG